MEIKRARKAAKMSQAELAEKIGVNRATLSKYENGQIEPSISQLETIAKHLNVSIFELLGVDFSGIRIKPTRIGPNFSELAKELSGKYSIPVSTIVEIADSVWDYISEIGLDKLKQDLEQFEKEMTLSPEELFENLNEEQKKRFFDETKSKLEEISSESHTEPPETLSDGLEGRDTTRKEKPPEGQQKPNDGIN